MQAEAYGTARVGLVWGLLLCSHAAQAQASRSWVDPPPGLDQNHSDGAGPAPSQQPVSSPPRRDPPSSREKAAVDLAHAYLGLWSAPNRETLASASTFYAPVVTFHGRRRTLASVLAEKRRFMERWPDRIYRHRPEATEVACEDKGTLCTVRASFDFAAGMPRKRQRTSGIGEHELVVSFAGERPVIVAENSRVVRRGHGNMTALLDGGVEQTRGPIDRTPRRRGARQNDSSVRSTTSDGRALSGTSVPELQVRDAVAACGEYLTAEAQRLGSQHVSVSSAGPEVKGQDGAVAQPVYARIEYARGGKKQVRQARITCRVDPVGRVVGLQE